MNDAFPAHLARGITQSECVENGRLRRCVFVFTKNRDNCLYEMSVQWLDNPESEQILKSQRRAGDRSPQFRLGFAVLSTGCLNRIIEKEEYTGASYCRVPNEIPGIENPYHGHITLPLSSRGTDKLLAAELAENSEWYEFHRSLPVGREDGPDTDGRANTVQTAIV